jgi:hypothetical protein
MHKGNYDTNGGDNFCHISIKFLYSNNSCQLASIFEALNNKLLICKEQQISPVCMRQYGTER